MTQRKPAEVFPPGEFIKDELEARGWSQADLAVILHRPIQVVNEIIAGKKAITPPTACGLASAFGTSPEVWLRLENAYRLSLAQCMSDDVARRARLYGLAPIGDLLKRGWIRPSSSLEVLARQVADFFELTSIEDEPAMTLAPRKASSYHLVTSAQRAWCYRARHLAKALKTAKYDKGRFSRRIADLRTLSIDEQSVRRVPEFLADLGIRFVVVRHLPKSRIDGATFWLDSESPVVVMSLRYGRIDYFWFTLMHELAHVKQGERDVDTNLVGTGAERTQQKPEAEQRADKWASATLIPPADLNRLLGECGRQFSKDRIREFAQQIGVHPGIVVGQLQFRDRIGYSHSREMLVDVRPIITEVAVTDGWSTDTDLSD